MSSFLQHQESKNAALEAARLFKINHRGDNVVDLFVSRTVDDEFAVIGKAALAHRDTKFMDEHLMVWKGYEIVTDSKYLVWN